MSFEIKTANIAHLDECVEAVLHSRLGDIYYSDVEQTTNKFSQAIVDKEIHVALDSSSKVVGFAWISPKGMFAKLPYLRTIAVKKGMRGNGIGKLLLQFFEDSKDEGVNHIYLLVSSFNPDAKRLYESCGYQQVGQIADWALKGIDEYIMMKRFD